MSEEFNLLEIIKSIESSCGKGSIISLSEDNRDKFIGKSITTGFVSLDEVTGIGGLPYSSMIEIYGKESSGKTTLAIQLMVQCQLENKVVALIDAEHGFNFYYAKEMGLSEKNFLMSQPDSAEQAGDIVLRLVSQNIGMVVVDSVAALTPQAEIEGEMQDQTMGLAARLMSKLCRKLRTGLKNKDTIVVFINQTRDRIGGYGNPQTTTGGHALKFYSALRFKLTQCAKTTFPKLEGEAVGIKVKIEAVKNKVGIPFKETELDLIFGKGFCSVRELINLAIDKKIITREGPYYAYDGTRSHGLEKLISTLSQNSELLGDLKEKVISG